MPLTIAPARMYVRPRAPGTAARAAGVDWYIVEQDEPADALNDIARSLRYLQELAGEVT